MIWIVTTYLVTAAVVVAVSESMFVRRFGITLM